MLSNRCALISNIDLNMNCVDNLFYIDADCNMGILAAYIGNWNCIDTSNFIPNGRSSKFELFGLLNICIRQFDMPYVKRSMVFFEMLWCCDPNYFNF